MASQLDDVRVLEHPHVLNLSLHTRLCSRQLDDFFGQKLQGNSLASNDVVCHLKESYQLIFQIEDV